jgi:hypothetical protein
MSAWLISPPSSGTLAFSLRLVPFLPAADFPAFARVTRLSHLWLTPHSLGPPPPSLLLTISSDAPPTLLRRSSDAPPTLLQRSSDAPPTLLRRSSDAPPTLLRRSSDAPPTLLRRSSDAPPTPWLPHCASCLPHLQQTPFHLAQAHPLLHRPLLRRAGPSPPTAHRAQTSTMYIYSDKLINDSVNN